MSEELEINQKRFISVVAASRLVAYSRDHITRLAREQKIRSVLVGRQWFVEVSSLQSYVDSIELEQLVRKRHLSIACKQERLHRERYTGVVMQLRTTPVQFAERVKALWWSLSAVTLGVGVGVLLFFTGYLPSSIQLPRTLPTVSQVATVAVPPEHVITYLPDAELEQAIPVTFTPTTQFDDLPTNGVGVLLLPGIAPTAGEVMNITALFSDPVVVRRDENGVRMVQAIDSRGIEVGPAVPFVTVPITHMRE